MNKPVPKPTIQLRLFGGNVRPESISVRTLAELTRAVQTLSGSKLHLMSVRRSSAGYQFAAEDDLIAKGRLILSGEALQEPENLLEATMLSAFDTLAEVARQLQCKVEMRGVDKSWRWIVGARQWGDIRRRSVMRDEAIVTGRLVRVGGATASKCGIQVANRKRMLICTLRGDHLARRLGEHLYEEVTLRGDAVFFVRDFKLISFDVDSFDRVKRGSFQEMYEAVRAAGGDAWDDIEDPIAEIEGMR